jgi:hypothetical protein
MAKSKMLSGSPILTGDNTTPGLRIHKEVRAVLPQIEAACCKMGLDYYPIIVEFVRYDEMAELASYGGFSPSDIRTGGSAWNTKRWPVATSIISTASARW